MGARKIETYPIHILSLTQIKVDHSIQSRVETSKKFERDFAEAMLRGDTFPPVTVYFDGKHYWLADGFHRYGATKQASRVNPKLSGIRAEVRNGTRRDAIIFSAGANQNFSIERTDSDKRKAAEMLFCDAEWGRMSTPAIAAHVGVGTTAIKRYRVEWHEKSGTPFPDRVIAVDGREKSSTRTDHSKKPPKISFLRPSRSRPNYRAEIKGKVLITRGTKEEVQQEVDRIEADREAKQRVLDYGKLQAFLRSRHIASSSFGLNNSSHPGLNGLDVKGVVVTATQFSDTGDAAAAVGRVLLLRSIFGNANSRAVIVCYPDDGPPLLIEAGRDIGVEFLTPEELAASLATPA